MRWIRFVGLGLVIALGCGGPQTTPDDEMTVEEHEAEAYREEVGADTAEQLAHAQQHRERAEALREFMDESCHRLDDAARSSCPLLVHLEAIRDIEGGVLLTFDPDADLGPVLEQLRCHLAFAAAEGSEEIDHCALYVPGAQLRSEENLVMLTTDQPEHVAELRERVAVQAP